MEERAGIKIHHRVKVVGADKISNLEIAINKALEDIEKDPRVDDVWFPNIEISMAPGPKDKTYCIAVIQYSYAEEE